MLLLLGRGELPPGLAGMVLPNQNENKVCMMCSLYDNNKITEYCVIVSYYYSSVGL